jgi:hypothetical protein
MNLKSKVCIYCKELFQPSGPAAKMCSTCKEHSENLEVQVRIDERRFRRFRTYEKIGRGNSQGRGELHHSFKNGIGCHFPVLRYKLKRDLRYCQECGRDLIASTKYEWCCHHIDHNRENNTIDNLTLLCKSCHQKEHECWKNFLESAETILKESTLK